MTMPAPAISVKELTIAYGAYAVQKNLTFTINRQDVFIIMGGSGCGKSSLLRVLVGLQKPATGSVHYGSFDFWNGQKKRRNIEKGCAK